MNAVNTHQQDTDITGKTNPEQLPYRTPWAALEGEANKGGTLIAWLIRAANERGQNLSDMAKELGVTYGYINQLRNGMRQVEGISATFTHSVARYLRIPPVLVMVAVGRIRIEDFLIPAVPRAARLKEGLHKLQADPLFGCVLPQSVWSAAPELQELVLNLYQEASQTELFPQRGLPMMLQDLQRAVLSYEEDKTRLADSRQA